MTQLSFDIKNSKDLFLKLFADYEEYRMNTTSSRKALNCAMTAWHLIDWIFYEFYYETSSELKTLPVFQSYLKIECPSLQTMHDITNGTKHKVLSRHNLEIKETRLHEGFFSNEFFSQDFDVDTLEIIMNDGSIKYFEEEIETVFNFFTVFLNNNHQIEI